jgi:hypothetical protein
MARSRNIKPGFFTNEILAEVTPIGRLLFAGLWTIADREGRLEDRPKRIKAALLPYDDCDVDELLNQLAIHQFICRYTVNGDLFIQVQTFSKHQNPHIKEQASTIPEPDMHQTCTGHTQNKTGSCTEVATLIPSSLIPDSINPCSDAEASVVASKTADQYCPAEIIVDAYNRLMPDNPRCKTLNASRRGSINRPS